MADGGVTPPPLLLPSALRTRANRQCRFPRFTLEVVVFRRPLAQIWSPEKTIRSGIDDWVRPNPYWGRGGLVEAGGVVRDRSVEYDPFIKSLLASRN